MAGAGFKRIILALLFGSASLLAAADSIIVMDFAQETPTGPEGVIVEATDEHATTGKGIKVTMAVKDYGWIERWNPAISDWSYYEFLAVDVYNPQPTGFQLGVTIR